MKKHAITAALLLFVGVSLICMGMTLVFERVVESAVCPPIQDRLQTNTSKFRNWRKLIGLSRSETPMLLSRI